MKAHTKRPSVSFLLVPQCKAAEVKSGSGAQSGCSTCQAPVYLPIWLSSLSIWHTAQGPQQDIMMQSLQMEPSMPNIILIFTLSARMPAGTQNGTHTNSPSRLEMLHIVHGIQKRPHTQPLTSSMHPVIGVDQGLVLAWLNTVVLVTMWVSTVSSGMMVGD